MATPCKPGETAPAYRIALVCAVTALISACGVTVSRPGAEAREWMSQDEFRAYAEQVFRRHNTVENELMFLLPRLESEQPARYHRLVDAEEEMLEACHALASAASQRGRGLDIGFFTRLRLPSDVAACERETLQLERMLAN